jgi:hypothetical protein
LHLRTSNAHALVVACARDIRLRKWSRRFGEPRHVPASAAAPINSSASIDSSPSADGEWAIAPHDYASTRFSTLADANTGNVSQRAAC